MVTAHDPWRRGDSKGIEMDVFLLDLVADQHRASLSQEAAEERQGRDAQDARMDRDRQTRHSLMRSARLLVHLATHDAYQHHLHRHRLTHHA